MTTDQLCALALAAIDDADAMKVLQDVVLEMPDEQREPISSRVIEEFGYWSATIDARTNARAIAAVLLFGDWTTSWSLADRCRLPGYRWSPDFVAPISQPREFPRDVLGDD